MSRYEPNYVSSEVDDEIARRHTETNAVRIRMAYYVLFWGAVAAIAHFGSLKSAILVLSAHVFYTFFNSFTMHYENIVAIKKGQATIQDLDNRVAELEELARSS